MQKFVEQKVLAGHYRSIDEVIEAGLETLEREEQFGDFEPGELDQLIAEGQRDLDEGRFEDGVVVFRRLREMSQARRRERHS
jgi:putative addiction module CopG family antidote